jgi:hypothetical protein
LSIFHWFRNHLFLLKKHFFWLCENRIHYYFITNHDAFASWVAIQFYLLWVGFPFDWNWICLDAEIIFVFGAAHIDRSLQSWSVRLDPCFAVSLLYGMWINLLGFKLLDVARNIPTQHCKQFQMLMMHTTSLFFNYQVFIILSN